LIDWFTHGLGGGAEVHMRFLLHAHPCTASGTTTSVTRASPKLGKLT